jgi:solute carrier family 6 amino acid transporter-like protein 5/7/9/14
VFAGFAIFAVLGFLATELEVPIDQVVQSGAGLAFVAYPDLVTRLPGSPFWAVLFFFMLFTLGLDSQFAIVETVLTGVLDYRPQLRPNKTLVVAVICILGFICGLPLTTEVSA